MTTANMQVILNLTLPTVAPDTHPITNQNTPHWTAV